jgi:hypothetical protein
MFNIFPTNSTVVLSVWHNKKHPKSGVIIGEYLFSLQQKMPCGYNYLQESRRGPIFATDQSLKQEPSHP